MDCATSHIELKKHLNAMLRASGTLTGLPIVEVSGHTSPGVNCENAHLTFEDFVRMSIGVDGCGKPALRVKVIDSCTLYMDCNNNANSNPLARMFAFDSTAKTYALVLNRSE